MENLITIPKYNGFLEPLEDRTFKVTYLKGSKPHLLKIVVNSNLTKQSINILDHNQGYKDKILKAISEYVNNDLKVEVKKRVKIEYLRSLYSKRVIKRIEAYLLPINKETSRDRLTKYNLI